jgi:hypothetical protein
MSSRYQTLKWTCVASAYGRFPPIASHETQSFERPLSVILDAYYAIRRGSLAYEIQRASVSHRLSVGRRVR